MYEDPKSKISQLEKILDSREDLVSKKVKRHVLHDHETSVPQNWDDQEFAPKADQKPGLSLALKILIGSVVFFIIALIVVFYKFIGGGNVISGDNISLTVKAPISVAGGEVLPFEVEIKNNNDVALKSVDLGVIFPASARQVGDTSLPMKRAQEYIGDIAPGASVKKNLSTVLFGLENEKQNIDLDLEYKVAGSNSNFNKTKSVSVLISSTPASIVVTAPKEINTNQPVDFVVDVTSNSPTVIKNLLVKADYPFGFSFSSSNPLPFTKNNLWLIGDLEPGAKRTIKLSGQLSGQEGEERGFTFNLGTAVKLDNLAIDTSFTSAFSSVTIRRPFVSADIFLNEDSSAEYVTGAGEKIEAIIKWQNNLSYPVSDLAMTVKINGNAVDKSAIQAEGGFYRSIDNTIIFNKTTNSDFASLNPGQGGESKFVFGSFSAGSVTGAGLSNPTINLSLAVTGKRVGYAGSLVSDVLFSDTRTVKIIANPQLFAKSLYYVGPFQNTGAIPPKAETETTYTVVWTVTNPLNNLSGASVRAVLPPYVKWLEKISPDREKISYKADTGEIVWSVGNVLSGAGTISPAREVAFQVSFLPSVAQIGSVVDLIGEVTLQARDTFTQVLVSDIFPSLTTNLSSDPYFKVDSDTVVQ